MSNFSRRTILAAPATTFFAARALPAFAATPYAFKHGAFELTVISDGHLVLPVSFLAPDAPPAEREVLLKAADQTGTQFNSPTNVTLIRTANDLILIDMGSGDRFMPTAGKLWDNLKAAGIDKSKITKVIFTHGHPDHLFPAPRRKHSRRSRAGPGSGDAPQASRSARRRPFEAHRLPSTLSGRGDRRAQGQRLSLRCRHLVPSLNQQFCDQNAGSPLARGMSADRERRERKIGDRCKNEQRFRQAEIKR